MAEYSKSKKVRPTQNESQSRSPKLDGSIIATRLVVQTVGQVILFVVSIGYFIFSKGSVIGLCLLVGAQILTLFNLISLLLLSRKGLEVRDKYPGYVSIISAFSLIAQLFFWSIFLYSAMAIYCMIADL